MAEVTTHVIHALPASIVDDVRRPAGQDADLPGECKGVRCHGIASEGDVETVWRRPARHDRRTERIECRLHLTTEPAN